MVNYRIGPLGNIIGKFIATSISIQSSNWLPEAGVSTSASALPGPSIGRSMLSLGTLLLYLWSLEAEPQSICLGHANVLVEPGSSSIDHARGIGPDVERPISASRG